MSRLALALVATLALSPAAPANPGNGKGGGGGGNEEPLPEPDPAPVSYVLSWIESPGDATRLADIDANGVAVGQVIPGGEFEDRYGIVSIPDRDVINLNDVAAPFIPSGWRISLAYTISDTLIISGDLRDPAGGVHCYALQLADNGPTVAPSVSWCRSFSATSFGSFAEQALVHDASNSGDLSITILGASSDETYVWTPAAGDPLLGATVRGPFVGGRYKMNSNRELLAGTSVLNVDAGTSQAISTDAGKGLTGSPADLNDAGSVFGRVKEQKGNPSEAAARFANGGWERIGPWVKTSSGGSAVAWVNNSGDALGFAGGQIFLFSEQGGMGFRLVDDLLDPAQDLSTWNSAGAFDSFPENLSEANATGFGYICGARVVDGLQRAFILTPTVAP